MSGGKKLTLHTHVLATYPVHTAGIYKDMEQVYTYIYVQYVYSYQEHTWRIIYIYESIYRPGVSSVVVLGNSLLKVGGTYIGTISPDYGTLQL